MVVYILSALWQSLTYSPLPKLGSRDSNVCNWVTCISYFYNSYSSWPNGHGVRLRTERFQVRVLAGKIYFLFFLSSIFTCYPTHYYKIKYYPSNTEPVDTKLNAANLDLFTCIPPWISIHLEVGQISSRIVYEIKAGQLSREEFWNLEKIGKW